MGWEIGLFNMTYDPRYLAGITLFNRGDYFEAHEVWESVWMSQSGPDKQFYQGLIQAAVGLCHFCNGNVRGALKLYHTSRDYLGRYPSPHLGLDWQAFWKQMEKCYGELLAAENPDRSLEVDEELLPTIELNPNPEEWPEPEQYLDEDDHS